jgi:hypothetical protein
VRRHGGTLDSQSWALKKEARPPFLWIDRSY